MNDNLGSTTSSANVNSELLDSIPLSISKPCSIPESHHANSNALSNNSLNPSVINSSNTLDPVPPSRSGNQDLYNSRSGCITNNNMDLLNHNPSFPHLNNSSNPSHANLSSTKFDYRSLFTNFLEMPEFTNQCNLLLIEMVNQMSFLN